MTLFHLAFNSLSKIFSSSDIQRELPTPTKDLVMVDHTFKLWGKEARDSPKVFKLCANQKAVAEFKLGLTRLIRFRKLWKHFSKRKKSISEIVFLVKRERAQNLR
jgi:dynein heavy chain